MRKVDTIMKLIEELDTHTEKYNLYRRYMKYIGINNIKLKNNDVIKQ